MIRPLLLEAPEAPRRSLSARARAFFSTAGPAGIVAGAFALRLVDGLLSLAGFGLPRALSVPAGIVLWLFLAWLGWRALRWLANRLLWRIRTKLIVSYLFIALVPVVLLTLFMAVAFVLLLGLTASRLVTADVERASDVLLTTCRSRARRPARERRRGGARAAARASGPRASCTRTSASRCWREGRVVASSGGARAQLPGWLVGPSFKGLVPRERSGERPDEALRVVWMEKGEALLLELPVDASFLGRDREEDQDPRAGGERDAGRGARRAGSARGPACASSTGPGGRSSSRRAAASSRPRIRRGCCSWRCRTGPRGRPERRARSRARPGRSSTTRCRSSGASPRSSCRRTRAAATSPTCCSTRSASWAASSS